MVKLWSRKQIVKTCTVCVTPKAYNAYDIQNFYSRAQMLKKNSMLNSWGNIMRTIFSRFYYTHHHGVQAHFDNDWAVNNPPLVAEVVVFTLNQSKSGEKWDTIQRFKELWSPTPSSWLAFRKGLVPEYCWESKASPAKENKRFFLSNEVKRKGGCGKTWQSKSHISIGVSEN